MDEIRLKKQKIDVQVDDNDFSIPATENIQRKKCAKIDDGLAIKYNKLVYNFEKIIISKHFRKYCVFFDIFSKRHLINHKYRIDKLETLNRFDFSPYAYEQCICFRSDFSTAATTNMGFIICFESLFMERKKYRNHKEEKSEYMKQLYKKHSILFKDNNFYDNRINECFMQKIRKFEELKSILLLNESLRKTLLKHMYSQMPNTKRCLLCKNTNLSTFESWRIVRFSNCLNMSSLCDNVLRLDDEMFLIPNYMDCEVYADDVRIVVYKTTKANIVLLFEDIFYVIKSHNLIIIFDLETFRKVQFFCNFNFYFIRQSKTYTDTNYININCH
ncbi:uncharacterized protein LOC119612730 [Lucilia sericata]|uniref:uncharacterized protein LOC119612730 n=1 Tax=Lucilia sericata TaxID=13632 RepID=UPI0018A7FCFB|nr:uncharacterized protein LOC119612730 [Lucilia sericata]